MHVIAAASGPSPAVIVIIWIVAVAAYWTPTIIGAVRHVPNIGSVAVVNFFGFLFVTWIVALAMAARSVPPAQARARDYLERERLMEQAAWSSGQDAGDPADAADPD